MKKLTAALVLVGLLTLPVVGLADSPNSQANPPKPGTKTNPGLWEAMFATPYETWGNFIVTWLLYIGKFPWIGGK